MEDVPDGVLDQLVVAEGAVAALVGDDPAPGGARAGDEGVRDPRGEERELEGKVEVREDAASDGGAVEMAAYIRDLAVSLTKQCLGILLSTSAMLGKVFWSAFRAEPSRPE